jgi:small subunit ribosomal protein S18
MDNENIVPAPQTAAKATQEAASVTVSRGAASVASTQAAAPATSVTASRGAVSAASTQTATPATSVTASRGAASVASTQTAAPAASAPETRPTQSRAAENRPAREQREYRPRSERDNARNNSRRRKKVCQFCADKNSKIDYKEAAKLRRFISERYKILPRRTTGTCSIHQRELAEAIKRARQIALLPYVPE